MKKVLKFALALVLLLIVVVNASVALHSYKFTHFDVDAPQITENDIKGAFDHKLKLLLTGLTLPKPQSTEVPSNKYDNILIDEGTDHEISAWRIYTDSIKKGTVLIFHGYIDQRTSMLDRTNEVLKMGYDVILPDFMGCGKSYGNQTTMGYLESENVKSVYSYALETLKEDNLYLFGFSMGAAAIMRAQAEDQMNVAGIILEAPYSTFENTIDNRVKNMGLPQLPFTTLFTFWMGYLNGFDAFEARPIEYAQSIHVPTLLMCGLKDTSIPKAETEAIFQEIGSPSKTLKLFENSTHQSYLIKHKKGWLKTVSSFFCERENSNIHRDCKNYFDSE